MTAKKSFWPAIHVIALIGISLYILLPLLSPGFPVTDDGDWMIIRLTAFFQSLRQGQFPVRFLERLNFNYGYPVANFLYPGFLYIGSVFRIMGLTYADSVKFVMIMSFMGSVLGAYWWLRRNFSSLASLAGAASLALSTYITFDIYRRGSVGEILAVFAFVLLLLASEYGSKALVGFSSALVVVSHNTLAMVFLFVFGLHLYFGKKTSLIPGLLLGLGMSAFFWVPALYERRYVIFDTVTVSNPFEYFVTGPYLHLISLIKLVLCILIIVLSVRSRKQKKISLFFPVVFLTALFLASPLSAPVWTWESFVRLIQFPYRLMAVEVIAGVWILAAFVDRIRVFRSITAGVIILLLLVQWASTKPEVLMENKPEGFYATNEATTTVSDEYMPKWVTAMPEKRPPSRMMFSQGEGTITPMDAGSGRMDFEVFSSRQGIIRINKIYYPGWGVTVNGAPVPLRVVENEGVMEFDLPAGIYRVEADFRETPGRFAVDLVSVISLVAGIILGVREYVRKRSVAGI